MSDEVVLRVREAPSSSASAECVRPDVFAELDTDAIRALPLWIAGERHFLGDVFEVHGQRSPNVRIEGDAARFDSLGEQMMGGSLVVSSDAGRFIGRGMEGGVIHVHGSVGDGAGAAPPGASKGMRGGEIIVRGSAGAGVGSRMRRGVIVVCGAAGAGVGRGMLAGTIAVFGDVGADSLTWSKRGTLIAMGRVEIPRTFRYACSYRPLFVRLLLRSVRTRHGLDVDERWITGVYRRHSGDFAELGRGEILHWTST